MMPLRHGPYGHHNLNFPTFHNTRHYSQSFLAHLWPQLISNLTCLISARLSPLCHHCAMHTLIIVSDVCVLEYLSRLQIYLILVWIRFHTRKSHYKNFKKIKKSWMNSTAHTHIPQCASAFVILTYLLWRVFMHLSICRSIHQSIWWFSCISK